MDRPLQGLKVIEMAGIGPAPFCAMMLADHGADVVRIDRPIDVGGDRPVDPTRRSRRSIAVDLKNPDGAPTVLRMVERADVIIEGFRPGVMERLGLGPAPVLERNPTIVYGRMTGWGQSGPYSSMAGHDINYIALAGALEPIGRRGQPPVPPLNLVGDFGGGGMLLAFGIMAAVHAAQRTGEGSVIDAAMVDGAAILTAMFHGFLADGSWTDERGTNLVDSGAPFYDVYETSDGKYVSIGPIEEVFHRELLVLIGLQPQEMAERDDRARWPEMKERMARVFRTRTRDEWCAVLEGTDACFAPVLTLSEASSHPHNVDRGTFIEVGGVTQPAPAPRFSSTPTAVGRPPARAGEHTSDVLREWGFNEGELSELRAAETIAGD